MNVSQWLLSPSYTGCPQFDIAHEVKFFKHALLLFTQTELQKTTRTKGYRY